MKKLLTALFVITILQTASSVCAQTMIIHTVAGNGTSGFSGDGGPATAASFNSLADVAVDAAGNMYLADEFNHRIRKVDAATGIINTIAGTGFNLFGGDGGPATAASFSYPTEVKLDAAGNIYIVDNLNNRIRKISAATGIITTIAGGGTTPYHNGMIATSMDTSFRPKGLGVDPAGNCYFFNSDAFFTIQRILRLDAATGTLNALADSGGNIGFSGDGGLAVNAKIDNQNYFPGTSLGIDATHNAYFTDVNNHRLRKVNSATGIISTVAGNGTLSATGDGGPATAAGMGLSCRIAINSAGDIYFVDYLAIRKIDASTQTITTIGGGGTSNADNIPATAARIYDPYGMAVDAANNVYYVDHTTGYVRMLTPACTGASAGTITSATGPVFCDSARTTLTLTGASSGPDISYQWKSSTDGITWTNTGTNALTDTTGTLHAATYYKAFVTCITSGTADSTAIDTITVTHTPALSPITGPATVCETATITLSNAAVGGTWTSNNPAIATIGSNGVVTPVIPGTVEILYPVTNACGAGVQTFTITVLPQPAVAPITGNTNICAGSVLVMSDVTAGGTWNSSLPAIATVDNAGNITALTPGNTIIAYFLITSCGGAVATTTVTVSPAPDAGSITGIDSICPGGTIVLSETVSGGTWLSNNNTIATVSSSGIVTSLTSGNAVIRYIVTNSCGADTATHAIIVRPLSACVSSVTEITAASGLTIYPNPNPGNFMIEILSAINEMVHISVTNAVGHQVKTFTMSTNRLTELNLDVPSGVYLVNAETKTGIQKAKVTIIK